MNSSQSVCFWAVMCCGINKNVLQVFFEFTVFTLWQLVLRQPRNGVMFDFLPLVIMIPRKEWEFHQP